MAKKAGPGRPPTEIKKVAETIMLDPRYRDYLRGLAEEKDINYQEMIRQALYAFFGNPLKPKITGVASVPKIKPPKG